MAVISDQGAWQSLISRLVLKEEDLVERGCGQHHFGTRRVGAVGSGSGRSVLARGEKGF